jgi:tetratricopeptide (TPR) repeat protein
MRLFDYRTILSVAILLIVGCSKSTDVDLPITSTSEEAKKLYKEAWYYWDQGEGIKGWGLMEEALSIDPDFILANLYVPTNDPNKWREHRDRAKENSKNGNDYEKLAVKMGIAGREGRSTDYINLCKELVSKYPSSSRAYVILGDAYTELEDFDNAIANYEKALDINSSQYLAWTNLVKHQVTVGGNKMLPKNKQSKKLALKYANGLVKTRPDAPFSYQIKGNIERQYSDMEAARVQYNKMIEVAERTESTSLGAGYNLVAHTYLFSGDYQKSRENYEMAASRSPSKYSKISYGEFGVWSYLYENDYDGAVKALDKLDQKVDDQNFSESEVLNYKASNQFTKFIAHSYNQNKSGAYDALQANWSLRQERLSLNKSEDEVSQRNYETFNAWTESWYYVLFAEYSEAQKSLEKLYTIVKDLQSPGALDGYNSLSGMVSLFSGDPKKAVSYFENIEKENNVYFAYFKALALEAVGENEKAQEIFRFLANWNFQGWEPALVRGLAKDKVNG